jgi:nicotinate phosphoribosyltransferase
MWEMPILSTISELMHIVNGDVEKVDREAEYNRAFEKALKALKGGLTISDMGTRRRFDFQNHHDVLKAFCDAVKYRQKDCPQIYTGKFVGTSNVWFAKEFDLVPIGTMSHQIVSAEECVSGVFECNYQVMDKWSRCFNGDVGIFLYDNFSDVMFFPNLSKRLAKTFDGLRVDSGDEKEQTEKIIEKYRSLGIDPSTKAIVYSNALTIDKAIGLHKWLDGRMKDSYGVGTYLMAQVENTEAIDKTNEFFPYSNIVIKLTGFRITESREWQDCVKLSNDKGKMLGNKEKCEYILNLIKNCKH